MVGVLDKKWSQIVHNLHLLQSGLEKLGIIYVNGEVRYGSIT
jgi:hypothetical protein